MKAGREREVIKAIHYKEVRDFLEIVEDRENLEEEVLCYICKAKITTENFRAAARKSGKLLFCCDNPKCYRAFIEVLGE